MSLLGGVGGDGVVLAVALDDLSDDDALDDDVPADGCDDEDDWSDDAIDDDEDEGDVLEGPDGDDCDMLDEVGGAVVRDVVVWRSLQAPTTNAAAMATDNTERFIASPFVTNCRNTMGTSIEQTPSHRHRIRRLRPRTSVRSGRVCRKLPTAPHDLQHAADNDARRVTTSLAQHLLVN